MSKYQLASILSLSTTDKLGLGDLSPTRVTIELADRSVKVPKGKINDVLIRVRKFIYPVDFIVLETQPVSNPRAQTPVILGHPFLTTTNAIQHNNTQVSTSSNSNPSQSDESEKNKSVSQVHKPMVPFLNRLKKNKQNAHVDKIIEIFN